MTDPIAFLANVESFRYFNPAESTEKVLHFRRAWWDFEQKQDMWHVSAQDRKGNVLNAKHITPAYVADIMVRFRQYIEVTYREPVKRAC